MQALQAVQRFLTHGEIGLRWLLLFRHVLDAANGTLQRRRIKTHCPHVLDAAVFHEDKRLSRAVTSTDAPPAPQHGECS